jgi:adenylate cyclase
MPQSRQLAAILFTDIAGYTAIMQQNEQHAIKLVKRHRVVLEKAVSDYEGDVIEYFGDGSLCIFSSVTEAMHCALQIQQQLKTEPLVPLRIGLHIGEIVIEDGKVMGDGVNLASRIQSLGKAGSILFSKEIFDKIRNHHEFQTIRLGRFQLKNVAEPMEVFALANDGLAVPGKEEIEGRLKDIAQKTTGSIPVKWIALFAAALLIIISAFFLPGLLSKRSSFTGKEKSIAVLPFENIGNDTLQEYFSDGITEDIITQLSKIAGLKVISRTSVMQYKGSNKNIKEIAGELNVAAILEGSVRKEGNNVRITAQLIDANADRHIWAEQYDRNASEVFAIQSEVAQRIANQLNVKLTKEEGKRIGEKATGNVAAYEDYLKAKQAPWQQKEQLFLDALKKDSTFALAWAGLAYTYSKIPLRNPADKPYYIRKSLDAALTAMKYGSHLSETHMVLGDVIKTITLNPALSIKEQNKSISLNPNNAEAYVYLAFAQMELGKFEEAEANLLKAKQLDPLSGIMWAAWITYYRYSRNAEKLRAISYEIRSNERRGADTVIKLWRYFIKDEYDSIPAARIVRLNPVLAGITYTQTGKMNEARKLLDSLQMASPYDNAFDIGIISAWMGEKQNAIKYLNLAYRLYDYSLISIKVDKIFDPLRNEEGFKELLAKMGME